MSNGQMEVLLDDVNHMTCDELRRLVNRIPSIANHPQVKTAMLRSSMIAARKEIYSVLYGKEDETGGGKECIDAIMLGIRQGRHVGAQTKSGESILVLACRHGDVAAYFVSALLEDERTILDGNERNSLYWVTHHGQSKLLIQLLEKGCIPDAGILDEAIKKFGAGHEVERIMAHGAKPDITLCMNLLKSGRFDSLDIILEWDRTHLESLVRVAQQERRVDAAALLIMHGGDFRMSKGTIRVLFDRFGKS